MSTPISFRGPAAAGAAPSTPFEPVTLQPVPRPVATTSRDRPIRRTFSAISRIDQSVDNLVGTFSSLALGNSNAKVVNAIATEEKKNSIDDFNNEETCAVETEKITKSVDFDGIDFEDPDEEEGNGRKIPGTPRPLAVPDNYTLIAEQTAETDLTQLDPKEEEALTERQLDALTRIHHKPYLEELCNRYPILSKDLRLWGLFCKRLAREICSNRPLPTLGTPDLDKTTDGDNSDSDYEIEQDRYRARISYNATNEMVQIPARMHFKGEERKEDLSMNDDSITRKRTR